MSEQRLIDANAITDAKFHACDSEYSRGWNDALDAVKDNAPAIEPNVKRGEWTGNWISCDEDLNGYFDGYKCLECMGVSAERSDFCQNCGADMREAKK